MPSDKLISHLLQIIGIGSSQVPQECACDFLTYAGSMNAAATDSILNTLLLGPSAVSVPPSGITVIRLRPHIRVGLQFLAAHATDPNNKTAAVRGWLLKECASPDDTRFSEGTGRYAFELALTSGNTALVAGSSLLKTSAGTALTGVAKWVDTITKTEDYTVGGMTVVGNKADCAAEVIFDTDSNRYLLLSQTLNSGADPTLSALRVLKRQY